MDCLTLIKEDIEKWNRWRSARTDESISLAGQDLSHGYFFEGNFSGVDLSGANLRRACLIGADFSGANLSGADLREAYLGDANFYNANIRDANLTGAHLDRVDLGLAKSDTTDIAESNPVSNPAVKIAIARLSQRPTAHRYRPWQMLSSR
ncbi:MAG: pentapeptide repeat-containing protein [Cyanobacteria bacterium J06607_13]